MPTYKYRREDGTTFTIRQKITADALEECPETGQKVERVITGGMGFQLKGGGWYNDGYASTGASEASGDTAQSGAGDAGSSESGSDSAKENGAQADAGSTSAEKGEASTKKSDAA